MSTLQSHVSLESAVAVTVMVVIAANAVKAPNVSSQTRAKGMNPVLQALQQRLHLQSQNRLQRSRSLCWVLLKL